jgi:hypothetical protein
MLLDAKPASIFTDEKVSWATWVEMTLVTKRNSIDVTGYYSLQAVENIKAEKVSFYNGFAAMIEVVSRACLGG